MSPEWKTFSNMSKFRVIWLKIKCYWMWIIVVRGARANGSGNRLNHCVVCVFDEGCCLSLSFFSVFGFDFKCVAFAVESDNFYSVRAELVVVVGREEVWVGKYSSHNFEVFMRFNFSAEARWIFTLQIDGCECSSVHQGLHHIFFTLVAQKKFRYDNFFQKCVM